MDPGPWGVRATLEALGGWATETGGGLGGGVDRERRADDGEAESERVAKVARLEEEIERLRSENLRWKKVCLLDGRWTVNGGRGIVSGVCSESTGIICQKCINKHDSTLMIRRCITVIV